MAVSTATSAEGSGVEEHATTEPAAPCREQIDQSMSTAFSGYRSSPIKRHRRTKAEIEAIKAGIYEIVEEQHPVAVRQTYYQAASVRQIIEKTQAEYQNVVVRLMLEMRRNGELPYHWVADHTRWMRRPRTYNGLGDFIETHQSAYRRSLWAESDTHVEIWIEKEGLCGSIYDVTAEYDVPLMASRGFASESFLFSAAEGIAHDLQHGLINQACIYFLGDYDPSGLKISGSIDTGLRNLCRTLFPDFEDGMLVFKRVAVNEDTIRNYNLPSRPTKTKGNTHAADWPDGRESVELDALAAPILRQMVRDCIERHIDFRKLTMLREIEQHERDQLRIFGAQLAEARP